MKKFLSLFLLFVSVKIYSQSQAVCYGSSATLAASPGGVPNTTLVSPGTPTSTSTSTNGIFIFSPTVTANYTLWTPGTPNNSVVMTVTVNPMPVINFTLQNPTCTSTISSFNFNLTFSPTGPAPTYTVAWAPPPPPPTTTIPVIPDPLQNSPTIATDYSCSGYISPGTYQASITAAGGCKVIKTFTILSAPSAAVYSIIPSALVQSVTCFQPTLTLTANNPGNTYTWTAASFTPNVSQSISATSTNTGVITCIGTNTNSGCTTTRTLTVVVNTVVPISVASPSTINQSCTTTTIQDFTLTATSPTVNFSHLISYPPLGNVWSSNLSTAIYQYGPPGTYTYTLKNNDNGCSTTRFLTVNLSGSIPSYTLTSPDSFTLGCGSKSVATVAFGAAQAGSPGAPLSYTFIPPNGNPNTTGPYGSASSITLTTPGNWTVICYETGSGCQVKTPMPIVNMTVAPKLDTVLFARGGTIYNGPKLCGMLTCDSTKVIMQAKSETPNISYNWAYGNAPIQNLSTSSVAVNATITAPSATIASNTVYTLTLFDNGNFCSVKSYYTVYHNVEPPIGKITPQNNGTNYLTCLKNTVVLTNQSSSGIKNPFFDKSKPVIGDYWQGPSPQTPLSVSSSYTAGLVGEYTMTARDMNNGCVSNTVFSIFDDRLTPNISLPSSFVLDCGPIESLTQTLCLTVPSQSDISNFTYTWTPPIILPGSVNTGSCYIPKSIGVFSVLVTNSRNGCSSPSTVQVNPSSIKGLVDVSTVSGFAPLEVNFFNNTTSGAGTSTGITAFWNFGNGTGSVTASPGTTSTTAVLTKSASTIYKLPGTYTVKVIVSMAPCRDSVTKTILVDIPSSLVIPNIFTPNGDGINDFYFLKTNSLSKISMSIYDRWGRLIFDIQESTSGNISWDGNNPSGKEAPDGTYFYFMSATGKDGVEFTKNGTITLSR